MIRCQFEWHNEHIKLCHAWKTRHITIFVTYMYSYVTVITHTTTYTYAILHISYMYICINIKNKVRN